MRKDNLFFIILILVFINISSFSQSILSNIEELENFAGEGYVYLKGYYDEGDGGEGAFFLKESNLSQNDGTIIDHADSNLSNRKWIRSYHGAINIKWFGVKGDGSENDNINIQKAIDALPDDGGDIYIPKGKYKLDNVVKILDKNSVKIILSKGALLFTEKHGYGIFEISNSENILIEGGYFKGSGDFLDKDYGYDYENENEEDIKNKFNGEKGITAAWGGQRNNEPTPLGIYNNGYIGNSGIGILIRDGSKNVQIKETEISGFNYSGIQSQFLGDDAIIQANYCSNIIISDNYIHDIYGAGISIHGSNSVRITNNYIENIGHPDASMDDPDSDPGYGITLRKIGFFNTSAKEVLISNNIITNCKRRGIDSHDGSNITVSNNTITNSIISGIGIQKNKEGDTALISNNTIINSALGSRRSSDLDIDISLTGRNAIENNLDNSIIANNIIKDSGSSSSILNISNNTIIDNNSIHQDIQSPNPDAVGIFIRTATNSRVSNNNIFTKNENLKLRAAIQFDNTKKSIVSNNYIDIPNYIENALLMTGSNNVDIQKNKWNSTVTNSINNFGQIDPTKLLTIKIKYEYGIDDPIIEYHNIGDINIEDLPGGRGHAFTFPRHYFDNINLNQIHGTVYRIKGHNGYIANLEQTMLNNKFTIHFGLLNANTNTLTPISSILNNDFQEIEYSIKLEIDNFQK